MKPAAARLLLVEDDAAIRRFVELALEEMPLELVSAASLGEAERALAAAAADGRPFDAVVSDLMLPDGSGASLLRTLAEARGTARGPRLVAFSAGVSAERREQLEAIGVDEILMKPVALSALEACVQRVIDRAAPAAADAPAAAGSAGPAAEAEAIDRFFAGDAALFASYRDSCRGPFRADLAAGDAALRAGDHAALRRLGHDLKTVLLTLGEPQAAECAAQLEACAEAGEPGAASWAPVAAALRRLAG